MTNKNICFFCQREINEHKPENTIANYKICDECLEVMNEGITLIAVTEKPIYSEQYPICKYDTGREFKTFYPTGEWAVFSEETIRLFFDEKADNIINKKITFIDPTVFTEIKNIYSTLKVKKPHTAKTENQNKDVEP